MADDPFELFDAWFAEARSAEPNDPDAMALATVASDGRPSVRMVLLKSASPDGFTFHTNALSRKGAEMAANQQVAAVLHWKSLRRQVRIEGVVADAPDAESDAYFASRGRLSQVSAWASKQSRSLSSREELEARQAEMEARFAGGAVPRPPHWHGFRIVPRSIEFWSDGPNRLHHRRLFTRRPDGSWDKGLLYP